MGKGEEAGGGGGDDDDVGGAEIGPEAATEPINTRTKGIQQHNSTTAQHAYWQSSLYQNLILKSNKSLKYKYNSNCQSQTLHSKMQNSIHPPPNANTVDQYNTCRDDLRII